MDTSKNLKEKTDQQSKLLEQRRQFFHAIVGVLIVIIFYYDLISLWLFFAVVLTAIVLYISWKDGAQPIIQWFFRNFEREQEKRGTGALWYVIGCFLTIILFPKNIAFAALMILALGDSVSHYVGRFYGKIPHPLNKKKNVEGTIAGIITGFLGAVIFVPNATALLASAIVMNVEVVQWKIGNDNVNDNFWIPLVAGGIMYLISLF